MESEIVMDTNSIEHRPWDDLEKNILVDIFASVGSETLLVSIQFVCKSWYDATVDPHCWTTLVFPKRSCSIHYVKSVVCRSKRLATAIFVPDDGLICDKVLSLSCDILSQSGVLLCDIISKWTNLEFFKIHPCRCFDKILNTISVHCNKLIGLHYSSSNVGRRQVYSVVQFLPKIKQLTLSGSYLSRFELVTLLQGCKELEVVSARYMICFRQYEGEITNLVSQLKSFDCSFSFEMDDSDVVDSYYDSFDDYSCDGD